MAGPSKTALDTIREQMRRAVGSLGSEPKTRPGQGPDQPQDRNVTRTADKAEDVGKAREDAATGPITDPNRDATHHAPDHGDSTPAPTSGSDSDRYVPLERFQSVTEKLKDVSTRLEQLQAELQKKEEALAQARSLDRIQELLRSPELEEASEEERMARVADVVAAERARLAGLEPDVKQEVADLLLERRVLHEATQAGIDLDMRQAAVVADIAKRAPELEIQDWITIAAQRYPKTFGASHGEERNGSADRVPPQHMVQVPQGGGNAPSRRNPERQARKRLVEARTRQDREAAMRDIIKSRYVLGE